MDEISEYIDAMTVSHQERYLNRPPGPRFDGLTIEQYFERFRLVKKDRVPSSSRNDVAFDQIEGSQQRAVICRRHGQVGTDDEHGGDDGDPDITNTRHIVRLARRWPREGAKFYLRLLLNTRLWRCSTCDLDSGCANAETCVRDFSHQPRTYEQLRIGPLGELHGSFEQAAAAYGLLHGMDEYTYMFTTEIDQGRTPQELQQLFVLCLLADGGFAAVDIWEQHADTISANFLHTLLAAEPLSDALRRKARDMALENIEVHLAAMGHSLSEFDLPLPSGYLTPLQRYVSDHPACDYARDAAIGYRPPRKWDAARNGYAEQPASVGDTLTEEQHTVFTAVMHAVENPSPHAHNCHIVTARAGRGKTFLMNVIVAAARHVGKVVLCVASTGLAALNFKLTAEKAESYRAARRALTLKSLVYMY